MVLSNVKDLAFGTHHSCFLFDNGTVSCTGKDEKKTDGTSAQIHQTVVVVILVQFLQHQLKVELNSFTQIDAGNRFTMGLLDVPLWSVGEQMTVVSVG